MEELKEYREFQNHRGFTFTYNKEEPRLSQYTSDLPAEVRIQADEVLVAAIKCCDKRGMMDVNLAKDKNRAFTRHKIRHVDVLQDLRFGLAMGDKDIKLLKVTQNQRRGEDGKLQYPFPSFSRKAHLMFAFEIKNAKKHGYHVKDNIYVRISESPTGEPWLDALHESK